MWARSKLRFVRVRRDAKTGRRVLIGHDDVAGHSDLVAVNIHKRVNLDRDDNRTRDTLGGWTHVPGLGKVAIGDRQAYGSPVGPITMITKLHAQRESALCRA